MTFYDNEATALVVQEKTLIATYTILLYMYLKIFLRFLCEKQKINSNIRL